ncbi:MAG TPA: hypothetical protein DEQ09_02200 [Bacteroidales bacterium]|nr:hypothetical protein [Bacteroidales bacterium]
MIFKENIIRRRKYLRDYKNIIWQIFGFQVLAAGSIPPENGFRYAFEKGADFICVGMFDWQGVQDINIAIDILNSDLSRKREWYA